MMINNDQSKKESNINTKNNNILSVNALKDNQFLSFGMMVCLESNFHNVDIKNKSIENLQLLLKYNLNKLFKKFISNSKKAKLQTESEFESLSTKIEQKFFVMKVNTLKKHEATIDKLKEQVKLIDNKISLNKNKNSEIKIEIQTKTQEINNQKNLLIMKNNEQENENMDPENAYKIESQNLTQTINSSEDIEEDVIKTKNLLKDISKNLDELIQHKNKIIEQMNDLKMDCTNQINAKYIFKEEQKTKLEMDKIEVFIFMRNNLLHLNRHIRNVKIQLAIKQIEEKWRNNEEIIQSIARTSKSIKKEFDLFDNILDNEITAFSAKDIDTNTRIINLKTYEAT